jgi:glycosyltransferase involved in cell wall biosynthesis
MKITHIIEASATGTLAMASLLANEQVRQGSSVEVIYSRREETPDNLEDHFDSSIKLNHIQMCSAVEKLKSIGLIRKELGSRAPNAVFMHSSFAGFLGRLAGLLILPNTRFLYIPHCISFMREDVSRLKKLFFISFEWIGAIKNSTYLACSRSEQIQISACIPFRECILIENAVKDLPAFNDQSASTPSIVTVGQIRPQKGPLEFANIALQIKSKMPNLIFRWVGDGDDDAKQTLIDAGVEVTGWVTKDEVIDYLTSSTIYLSSARWEGMPVSLIEANYAKLPVVASACPGNIDVVSHGKTGWLFYSESEAATQVLSALTDPTGTEKIIEHAFKDAQHRFNLDRYINDINALINK